MASGAGAVDRTRSPAVAENPRASVDAALTEFLAGQRASLLSVDAQLGPFIDLAEAYLDGGKRLRPAFCYWGWRSTGAAPEPALIRAAAALELLQACALIHDDVMDGSDTRRGMPSAHKRFEALHGQEMGRGDPVAFGAGAAILLGDLFLCWSDELLVGSGLADAALHRGRPLFNAMRAELMAGQFLDLMVQSRADPGRDAIRTVLRFKSAKYTIEHPLQLGALLAGGDNALVAGLGAFGLPLGEAFQLRDDLLGVFGDPAVTGKPAGDDLREGKQTLLIAEAMAAADEAQRELLTAGHGDPALDARGAAQLQDVLRSTGAVAAIEVEIDRLYADALAALRALDLPQPASEALEALARAAVQRVR